MAIYLDRSELDITNRFISQAKPLFEAQNFSVRKSGVSGLYYVRKRKWFHLECCKIHTHLSREIVVKVVEDYVPEIMKLLEPLGDKWNIKVEAVEAI